MNEFELGQDVKIKANGIQGKIYELWQGINAPPKYYVYYYDSTGRRAENWMLADEIEAL